MNHVRNLRRADRRTPSTRTTNRRRSLTIVPILGIALLASACGDDTKSIARDQSPDTTESADAPTTTAKPPVSLPTQSTVPPTTAGQQVGSLDQVQAATVQIVAQGTFADPEFGSYESVGRGSGFVVDPSGIAVTNGPAISPDGGTLYLSDTTGKRILRHSIDRATGRLSHRRLFATIDPGTPDGLTIDAAGRLWVAHYGGGCITRLMPDGTVDRVIELPTANVTSTCLGGPKLTTLYITTAEVPANPGPLDGALFCVEVDGPGLPEPIFAPWRG